MLRIRKLSSNLSGKNNNSRGFTLIELFVALAILAVLVSIAVPTYSGYVKSHKIHEAIRDIREISLIIESYRADSGAVPDSLGDVGYGGKLDPWGNPYQFFNIQTAQGNGQLRKDHNLVPINTDYDLYSMGEDGKSVGPIQAGPSRDDIIRANDGGYIGLSTGY